MSEQAGVAPLAHLPFREPAASLGVTVADAARIFWHNQAHDDPAGRPSVSVHAIAAEIRASIRAYRRSHRSGNQAVEHETKDSFCAALERQVDDLVRAVGTPALLSMAPGKRIFGSRVVAVVTRDRPLRKRAQKAA